MLNMEVFENRSPVILKKRKKIVCKIFEIICFGRFQCCKLQNNVQENLRENLYEINQKLQISFFV